MFCMKCGAKLPEDSRFCMYCGTSVQINPETSNSEKYNPEKHNPGIKLVKAQCTNCSAPLEVDSSLDAAICPYCNTPYIVERAINNYNVSMNSGNMNIKNAYINVSNGTNLENLLLRAERYEQEGDYNSALEYYNRVLDIDINQIKVQEAINKIKHAMEEYVYFRIDANVGLFSGHLMLKKGKLIYVNKKGKETVYYIERISNPRVTMGCLGFMYEGRMSEVTIGCRMAKMVVEMLLNAKKGIYPEMVF